jgi:hypothetical protein
LDAFLSENKTAKYPLYSKWSILKGEDQNKIMFVRRNDSAIQLMEHPNYKYRIGIAIPLLNPTSNGLSTDEEAKDLHSIEDSLISEIGKNQDAVLVLVITTGGMREFVFYTKTSDSLKDSILLIQDKYKTYKLQFYITEDFYWEVYKEFS